MWEGIDIWGFAAGLGLFLLGMFMLEQGLRGLGSRSMKRILQQQTRTPVRGVVTGIIATAILQSSSLVGLIVLAFVGAGILELRNALGVIIGSNLGTTLKGWIVTLIGFELDLVAMANPALALGALGTVFLKSDTKPYYYSNMLLGLSLILMGLGEMSNGFISLAENFDTSIFQNHHPIIYFLGGALFTAVIQSSSASMMIVLSALNAEIFSLHEAAVVVIGADLGTTSTILLGALKGSLEKRRVALSHFFYNLVTDILALLMLPFLLYFITGILHITDPLFALVAFHSLFNIVGIFLFLPFLDLFISFLRYLVPDVHYKGELGVHIERVPPTVAEAAIEAVRKELQNFIIHSIILNLRCFKINPHNVFPPELTDYLGQHNRYEDDYAMLKRASGEILGYTYSVQGYSQDEAAIRQLTRLNHAIRNISYAAKFTKDIRHNLAEFRHSESDYIQKTHTELNIWFNQVNQKLLKLLLNRNPELFNDDSDSIKSEFRKTYEEILQKIYTASGENLIDDEQTTSLLNVNRAIYLSTNALLEALGVLYKGIDITETALISEPAP